MKPIYNLRGAGYAISFEQFRTALDYMTVLNHETKAALEIEKMEKVKYEYGAGRRIVTKCVARSRAF